MTEPLSVWKCDTCGDDITDPATALVTWRRDDANRGFDFNGFVDLVRRTQTPWYEEARPHWQTEHTQHWLADANQVYPYQPDVLKRIAKQELGN